MHNVTTCVVALKKNNINFFIIIKKTKINNHGNLNIIKATKIIVTGRYNEKNKITEKIIKAQFTHVWTVNNNKATGFQQYTDTKQVADAMS